MTIPTNLTITNAIHGNDITLSWNAVAGTEYGYVYEFYVNDKLKKSGKTNSTNVNISASFFKASDLIYFKVRTSGLNEHLIGEDAETLMLKLVNNNIVNPLNEERTMQGVVLSENKHKGECRVKPHRYTPLHEALEDISMQSGLGWNVEIDTVNKQFVFKVLEGRDLTVNQSELPPAIFSTEFGTLGQMSYMESDLDYKSVAIVEGPDLPNQEEIPEEEKEKYMTTVGDAEGFERYEMLVGANIDTEIEVEENEREQRPEQDILADMITVGETELAENTQEIYVEGQALTKSRLVYQKDYDLGDMVTLQNKDWGITMDASITEIKEIYEPGNVKIDLTFDNSFPTLIDKIKKELKSR